MELPKLRRTVRIKFSSLRNSVGENMGMIFDIDTIVERKVYRVKSGSKWKWQIRGLKKLLTWDCFAEIDQEILDEHGSDLEFKYSI